MTKVDENIQTAQNMLSWIIERCYKLEEENKKLKEDSKTLESAIWDLVRENRRLKEERIFSLGEYDYMILTSTTPQLKIIKKNQNYSLMEEDTLQELRDLGEI